MKKIAFLFGVSAFALGSNVIAQEAPSGSAWSVEGAAVVDYWNNSSGGVATGTATQANIGAQLNFDGSKAGIPLLRGTFGGFYNNGEPFSGAEVGDAQGVSNIETGAEGFYLYENWISLNWGEIVDGEGQTMVKLGLIDLNGSFDAPNVSGLFMNSSHGIIPTFSQTGGNGPSIFPILGLGAIYQLRLGDANKIRVGVFDGVPGYPNDPTNIDLSLNKADGVLLVGEWEYSAEHLRLLFGGFGYSEATAPILAGPNRRNRGLYGQAELNPNGKYAWFLRAGTANPDVNFLENYVGAGVVINDAFAKTDHQIGFAVARAGLSEAGRTTIVGAKDSETNLELTYSAPLGRGLTLQSDIQHIINVGADPSIEDATVVGLRLKYEFGTN
ncbi:MAG: porin [Hyphomonadaceae bacterium]|nr:MAG: porin [Hyphomonadaceae bacterium]